MGKDDNDASLSLTAEEELPVKPQKEWLHMDKLEPEKLEWLRDLPPPRRRGTKRVSGRKEGGKRQRGHLVFELSSDRV